MNSVEVKSATEKLIYFTACIVIIYFPKLNEQKHYVEHDVNNNLNIQFIFFLEGSY